MTNVSAAIVFGATVAAVATGQMTSDEGITLASVLVIAGIVLAVIRRKVTR